MRHRLLGLLFLCAFWAGCGTTKWTDTSRTATEQLLISDSTDRAVSQLDLRSLAGKKVFLDDSYVKNVTDTTYLVSSLRQHILASGAVLREKREEADYVVEVRAGAVGTDRHDVLFGVPQTTIPSLFPSVTAGGATIPEIALVKRTEQRAVSKVAVFAYNRQTGRPIWQSGVIPSESKAKAVWVFGAGPFQRGNIYQGTKFAGDHLNIPLIDPTGSREGNHQAVSVAEQAYFTEPQEEQAGGTAAQFAQGLHAKPGADASATGARSTVIQASHSKASEQGATSPPVGASRAAAPASSPTPSSAAPSRTMGPSAFVPPAGAPLPEMAPSATPWQPGETPRLAAPDYSGNAWAAGGPAPLSGNGVTSEPRFAPSSPWPAGQAADGGDRPTGQGIPYPIVDPMPYYRR